MSEICSAFVKTASLLIIAGDDTGVILTELLDLSRALRAKCTGGDTIVVVDVYIQHKIPSTVVNLCSWFNSSNALKESTGAAELLALKKTLVLVLCQVMANFTACGEDARYHLASLSFDSLSHILSSAIMTESRKAVAAFLGAIYNCLLTADSDGPSVQEAAQRRRESFVKSRGFLCQVFLSVLNTSKSNITGTGLPDEIVAPADDPTLEWFHMLANVWVKHNLISQIFSIVGPTAALEDSNITDIVYLTHEQIIVLELATSVMEDSFFTQVLFPADSVDIGSEFQPSRSASTEDFHAKLAQVGEGSLVDLLLQLACMLGQVNTEVVFREDYVSAGELARSSDTKNVEDAVSAVEGRMRRGLTIDFLPLALQLLASTLAVLPAQTGRPVREALVMQTPLMSTLVRILRGRDVGSRARDAQLSGSGAFSHLPAGVAPGGKEEASSDLLKECIRLSLQLLGNLVYGCEAAKDALRESGALAAVLSHCATDFHNPISREWALLCVRNACDNHLANQTFIQELRPQEVVIQDEKLKEQGLRVEMNTETGQFKFVDANK